MLPVPCRRLPLQQLGANPDDEEGSEHADRREAATEKTMEADHGPNIPPAPAPNGNIVSSSRSKMFDRAAGFDGGHRGKPEMHAAMSEAQLQDIISQIYAQVAEDYRTISLTAGITRTLSPAQREARRQRQQNNMADNDRGSTWSYATWLGSMHGQASGDENHVQRKRLRCCP